MYVITGTNRVQKKSKKLRSEKRVQGELKMIVRKKSALEDNEYNDQKNVPSL